MSNQHEQCLVNIRRDVAFYEKRFSDAGAKKGLPVAGAVLVAGAAILAGTAVSPGISILGSLSGAAAGASVAYASTNRSEHLIVGGAGGALVGALAPIIGIGALGMAGGYALGEALNKTGAGETVGRPLGQLLGTLAGLGSGLFHCAVPTEVATPAMIEAQNARNKRDRRR